VLFSSVAAAAGPRAVALLLTGMGKDGAAGLLAIRRAGGRCLAQDEASSIVFGMPREAWECGAAEKLVPLDRAADELLACLADRPERGGPP
jgi:two-component system chemotaxis response regulator CheB